MKHTLETIKKALQNHFQQQDAVSFSKLKGEIEDTEKELREKMIHPTNMKSIVVYDFIKEFLGDS